MFIVIRLFFCSIIFIIGFILIRSSKINFKRRWYVALLILTAMLCTISAVIPFENAFMTFKTLESSYGYVNRSDIQLVVRGEKTDFVVGKNGDTDSYLIIPKTEDGWKLGVGSNTKMVLHTVSDGIKICVYQYKSSDDYYITILDTNGGESHITDNHKSDFYNLKKSNKTINQTFYTYFAYINDFDENYSLIIDGKLISIE